MKLPEYSPTSEKLIHLVSINRFEVSLKRQWEMCPLGAQKPIYWQFRRFFGHNSEPLKLRRQVRHCKKGYFGGGNVWGVFGKFEKIRFFKLQAKTVANSDFWRAPLERTRKSNKQNNFWNFFFNLLSNFLQLYTFQIAVTFFLLNIFAQNLVECCTTWMSMKRNTRFCPACRSNFRPRKWLKPIARYLRLNRFDQRSASLVISDRGILNFDFHIRHIHLMQFPLT